MTLTQAKKVVDLGDSLRFVPAVVFIAHDVQLLTWPHSQPVRQVHRVEPLDDVGLKHGTAHVVIKGSETWHSACGH